MRRLSVGSAGAPQLARGRAWRYNVERMANTKITWRDVLLMPEDGKRYEAIEGDLYVIPVLTLRH